MYLEYSITFIIGLVVAFAELLSRYKDSPIEILKILPSWIYLFINGGASILALWFITDQNIVLGGIGTKPAGKILISALSSMIVLRSSIFNFRVGEKNYDVGIATILQIFLNRADRSFDQKRSTNNLVSIEKIMISVDFKRAEKDLPAICLASMQNLSDDEQKLLADEVVKISKSDLQEKTKSLQLGIILARYTGSELLGTAVDRLKDVISKKATTIKTEETEMIEKIQKLKIKFGEKDEPKN
jgi:hypothetical protein